jgi:hypothetical protein
MPRSVRQSRVRGIFWGQFPHVEANSYEGVATLLQIAPAGQMTNTVWEGAAVLPLFSTSTLIEHNTGDVTLPLLQSAGAWTTGLSLSGAATLPMIVSSGRAGQGTYAFVELPLLVPAGTMFEQPYITGDIVIPLFAPDGLIITNASAWVTTQSHEVWVVNTETTQHSNYLTWQANSFAEFNGVQLIALPDGIYELIGDEDELEQIDMKVYWPPSDMGSQMQKRVDAVYANVRAEGNFRVVAVCDETQRRVYNLDMTNYPRNAHPKRVLFTRNLQGRYWQIGIENAGGSRLTVADAEAMPVELSRRLR